MMNRNLKRLCLATIVSLGSSLVAQDAAGPDYFFKMRGQAGLSGDSGLRNTFGVSAGANLKFGDGHIGLELAYSYNPGKIFRADFPAAFAFEPINLNQSNAVLTQKHQADMLGIRASYSAPINEDWSWHAGLGLYHVKARMESIGDFESLPLPEGDGQNVDGAWNSVTDQSSYTYEPYVGLGYRLSESGSLEFNLGFNTLKIADVTPVWNGADKPDYERVTPVYGHKSINNIKLEITYVFHF